MIIMLQQTSRGHGRLLRTTEHRCHTVEMYTSAIIAVTHHMTLTFDLWPWKVF